MPYAACVRRIFRPHRFHYRQEKDVVLGGAGRYNKLYESE